VIDDAVHEGILRKEDDDLHPVARLGGSAKKC
jgi:hypothetical protein